MLLYGEHGHTSPLLQYDVTFNVELFMDEDHQHYVHGHYHCDLKGKNSQGDRDEW